MGKKIWITLCILCLFVPLWAQSDPIFLQQTTNRGIINPAVAGKGGDINAAVGLREQWVGFPGPSTQVINASGFIRQIRSGIGINWINDHFGPQKSQNLKLNYAYYIPFEEKAFLSLGLGMGILRETYDESDFFPQDPDDDVLTYTRSSKTLPDFDFGLEFDTRFFEVGGSVTHLARSADKEDLLSPGRNIFAYTRFKIPMDSHWDFIPGFTWFNSKKMNTYELIAGFRYENNITVNLIYRSPMTTGIAFGINVYKGLRLSYSFDYGFNDMSGYNDGSHELFISYNVPINTTYVRSRLRFFKWKMF